MPAWPTDGGGAGSSESKPSVFPSSSVAQIWSLLCGRKSQAGWRKGGRWRSFQRSDPAHQGDVASKWSIPHPREGAGEGGGERNVHPLQISLFLEREERKSPTLVSGPRRGVLTCFFFPSLPTSNLCLIGRLAGGGWIKQVHTQLRWACAQQVASSSSHPPPTTLFCLWAS